MDHLDHIQDTTHVTVFLDDGELREFTLEDLKQGIAVHVRAGSEVSIYFDLLVKDDLNLDEVLVLKNTALIGDHTPEVEIPTGGSKLEAVKTYKDASGDEILQAGEVVTYGITIVNTGKVMAEGVFIQDTLSDLLKVLEDPSMNEVLIDVDGQVTKRVLKDLMQGFEMDIGAGSQVSISFTVKFIDELLIKQAVNTAHIDELRPRVSIPVEPSLPLKEVPEKPSPKPEVKPVKVAPKPSLPRTGMAVDMNPYILIALGSLLGVIGLRKRRRS